MGWRIRSQPLSSNICTGGGRRVSNILRRLDVSSESLLYFPAESGLESRIVAIARAYADRYFVIEETQKRTSGALG